MAFILGSIILISGAILALTIFFLPPKIEDRFVLQNLFYFFGSFWLLLSSGASLLLYFFSFIFKDKKLMASSRQVRLSIRRGVIFSTSLTLILLLLLLKLATWLNIVLLVSVAFILEIYWSQK